MGFGERGHCPTNLFGGVRCCFGRHVIAESPLSALEPRTGFDPKRTPGARHATDHAMPERPTTPAPDSIVDWSVEPDAEQFRNASALLSSDVPLAIRLLEGLAQRGSVRSMIQLGWEYSFGRQLGRDYSEAEAWFRRSIEYGAPDGSYYLGLLLWKIGIFPEALNQFEDGVKREYTPSMTRLGLMYYFGEGVDRNYGTARQYWERASNLGHVYARGHLGSLFIQGKCGAPLIPRGIALLVSVMPRAWRVIVRNRESDLLRR